MRQDPIVVVAATPRSWAVALRAHAADHGGVVIRATVLTPEDAAAEQCHVVIVDDVTSFLTPAFVAELQTGGRAVLGVYDTGDSQGKDDLVDAGVDALISADADPGELVMQITRLAARRPEDRPPPRPTARAAQGVRLGRTVGVTGPPGGVGTTEIAIELAACLGLGGSPTALVDADEVAPSHAQRLGLPLHPNLRTALQEVASTRSPDGCMHPLSTRRPLSALAGMAVPEDWGSVPVGAVGQLLMALAAGPRTVVVDLGTCPPPVEGPTGLRHGHAAALAHRCDDLLVVCSPTPTAVARTIALVARLQPVSGRLHLVLNRVGADRYIRDECVAELRRATELPVVHLLVEDPKVSRAAWQGARVPRGRFSSQVAALAAELALR